MNIEILHDGYYDSTDGKMKLLKKGQILEVIKSIPFEDLQAKINVGMNPKRKGNHYLCNCDIGSVVVENINAKVLK